MADVNYLLHRRQMSLVRADTAAGPESRAAHRDLARRYAEQVRQIRIANEIRATQGA